MHNLNTRFFKKKEGNCGDNARLFIQTACIVDT